MVDQDSFIAEEIQPQLESFRSGKDYSENLQNEGPLQTPMESLLKLDQSLQDSHQKQSSQFKAEKPIEYLQEIWDNHDDDPTIKQGVEEIVNDVNTKVKEGIENQEIWVYKPQANLNKHNLEQRIAEERVRRLQRRYAELKHKLEGIDSSLVLISPEQDRTEIEKIKSEMSKLDRVFKSLSPQSRKKPEYQAASELQQKYYDPSKKEHAKQFINQIHKDWEEFEKKKQDREAERDQREKEKMARLHEKIIEATKQRNEQKRMKLEAKIEELQQRQETRKRLQQEWKKAYQEYLTKKPLYKVKEEAYNIMDSQLKQEASAKALAQREQIVKPVPDYFFKEHQDNIKKKLEELRIEHERKRSQEKKEMKLPDLFHGKFHSFVEDEDRALKQSVIRRIENGKEQNEKRTKYAKLVRESIKLKKRSPDPKQQEIQKKHSTSMKSLEAKELYNMGLKYLDFSKKRIKKRTIKDNTAIDPFPDSDIAGRRNSDTKAESHRLPHIISSKAEDKAEVLSHRAASKSVARINYLPLLKQEHKGMKKVPDWTGVMNSNINKSEKMEFMKQNIQMYEEYAQRAEKRLKYAASNVKTDQEAANIDDFYIKSLKAKLALVGGL